MNYYVWCDDSCDNVTQDIDEARRWRDDFNDEGRDAYIVDENNNMID